MRASTTFFVLVLGLAGADCNVFIPDWGTQGKACHSDADCNGITCDPFATCAERVLFADQGNGGHLALPNPCGENVELSFSQDGEWAYLLVGCTKEPRRSAGWQIGFMLDESRFVVIPVASRDSPWTATDCLGIGPLLPFPNHNGLIAGCRNLDGDRLLFFERSANDWRLVMNPWQQVMAKALALSEEFTVSGASSRYVATIDNENLLRVTDFNSNSAVLAEPASPQIKVHSVDFPGDQFHLVLGGRDISVPTKIVLATINNNSVTFSDIVTDLSSADELSYSPGGNWLFGLVRIFSAPAEPQLYAWKVGITYDAPKIADCPACSHMVVYQEQTFNIVILSQAKTTPDNHTTLVEFKLSDDATSADNLTLVEITRGGSLPGMPADLAVSAVGPDNARTPLLVLATSEAVHLWDLKRLRAD
ncbi:MAG: hypothetical protein GYA21_05055 [Myxococcales bacterium]|nr:hypothetical protein [Myxococcales bacterium]